MRTMWWWLIAAGGTFWLTYSLGKKMVDIGYLVDPNQPYGKRWAMTRPPGLPESARHASIEEAAMPHVQRLARAHGLGEAFARTMLAIGDKESSLTFGRPANNFCETCSYPDKITAWGVFQWNDGAWDRFWERRTEIDSRLEQGPTRTGRVGRPWEATDYEEIAWPIDYYARLWRTVHLRGGDDWAAARALFMWHSGPTRFRRYRDKAAELGSWRRAWERIEEGLSGHVRAKYVQERRQAEEEIARWRVDGA